MIRAFQMSDLEQVYALGNLLTPNFSKTNSLHDLENNPFTKVLVYEKEGTIIGFLMYTELDETVDILHLFVKEEYRRQKIASNLLDTLISNLKESVCYLTLEVRRGNESAIALYQKFGLEIIHIRKNYYENEDAYLMGRRFSN